MKDFTYKFYDTPNLKTIQDDVFEIILKLDSGHLLTKDTYQESRPAIFEKVPLLVEFINTFHHWEDIASIAVIVVMPGSKHLIHRDLGPMPNIKYCMNIPIKNFEYSMTKFYKLKEGKKEQIMWAGGIPLANYNLEDVFMIDGLWCNRPCFFNTQIPHGVSNDGTLPRVLISIRPRTPFNLETIFK